MWCGVEGDSRGLFIGPRGRSGKRSNSQHLQRRLRDSGERAWRRGDKGEEQLWRDKGRRLHTFSRKSRDRNVAGREASRAINVDCVHGEENKGEEGGDVDGAGPTWQ